MKFLRFIKFAIALAWIVSFTGAMASPVGTHVFVGFGTQGADINGLLFVPEGSYLDTTSAATQNSTLVTERRVTMAATEAQTKMALSQISDRMGSHSQATGTSASLLPTGGNAGSFTKHGSIWARVGYDKLNEDNITSFGGWKANLWSFAIGYDNKINEKVLAGAAITYSNINGSTAFNKGYIKDNTFAIVPYFALMVNRCLDLDLIFGYSRVYKSRDRITPSTANPIAGLTGAKATSAPKSDRFFGSAYANIKHLVNRWNLLARLGYLYATDRQKSYIETNGLVSALGPNALGQVGNRIYSSQNTNTNRISLHLQAGFKVSASLEPYAFLTYAYDLSATKMNVQDFAIAGSGISMISPNMQRGKNTFGGGIGLSANLANQWATGLEVSYAQNKKFKDTGAMVRLRKLF